MSADDRAEPTWIDPAVVEAIHERQLAEHGGGTGLRDRSMLESALARPVNRWGYGEDDLSALAAAYAFGIARNHPFVDGNKRTAWVLARLFLVLNGHELDYEPADAIRTVLALAGGDLAEEELAGWLRERLVSAA